MGVSQASGVAGKSIVACTRGVLRFYRDGFRAMVLGRTLWKIILIKLVVMFAILKLFFFPDILGTTYKTDSERAAHVLHELTLAPVANNYLSNKDGK